jgi:hypothetical protein
MRRRRLLLGGAGAGALAAAATVFGGATPAFAANWHCCNLVFNPPNESLSTCLSGSSEHKTHYVWTCHNANGSTCRCCESYWDGQGPIASGAACP